MECFIFNVLYCCISPYGICIVSVLLYISVVLYCCISLYGIRIAVLDYGKSHC